MLKVVDVDLRIGENAKAHHTDRYEWTQQRETDNVSVDPCLVVRRGEPFDIFIRFDRPFDSSKDDIQLIFDFGNLVLSIDTPLPLNISTAISSLCVSVIRPDE